MASAQINNQVVPKRQSLSALCCGEATKLKARFPLSMITDK
jgi:hypothetical protein